MAAEEGTIELAGGAGVLVPADKVKPGKGSSEPSRRVRDRIEGMTHDLLCVAEQVDEVVDGKEFDAELDRDEIATLALDIEDLSEELMGFANAVEEGTS